MRLDVLSLRLGLAADGFRVCAANVKQVLVIVLAVLIFNVSLNPTNLFGISLTLIGGACASLPFLPSLDLTDGSGEQGTPKSS